MVTIEVYRQGELCQKRGKRSFTDLTFVEPHIAAHVHATLHRVCLAPG